MLTNLALKCFIVHGSCFFLGELLVVLYPIKVLCIRYGESIMGILNVREIDHSKFILCSSMCRMHIFLSGFWINWCSFTTMWRWLE